jgi:hypothetical protein
MADTRTLHTYDLIPFIKFCTDNGWKSYHRNPNKPEQILRMRHPDFHHPLIVHVREQDGGWCMTWGLSLEMARKFIESGGASIPAINCKKSKESQRNHLTNFSNSAIIEPIETRREGVANVH